MKQKILFNLFFKIYAKKVPLSRKTYIFVQNGSIYPKPELSFSAYPPPEIYPQTLPFFASDKYFLKTRGYRRYFFPKIRKQTKRIHRHGGQNRNQGRARPQPQKY